MNKDSFMQSTEVLNGTLSFIYSLEYSGTRSLHSYKTKILALSIFYVLLLTYSWINRYDVEERMYAGSLLDIGNHHTLADDPCISPERI